MLKQTKTSDRKKLAGSLIQAYRETDQHDKGGVRIIYTNDSPNASGITKNTLTREMKSSI